MEAEPIGFYVSGNGRLGEVNTRFVYKATEEEYIQDRRYWIDNGYQTSMFFNQIKDASRR